MRFRRRGKDETPGCAVGPRSILKKVRRAIALTEAGSQKRRQLSRVKFEDGFGEVRRTRASRDENRQRKFVAIFDSLPALEREAILASRLAARREED